VLDQYLTSLSTITERFSFPWQPKTTAEAVDDKVESTKEFIKEWQIWWEKLDDLSQ
jgi:hypothetical protein